MNIDNEKSKTVKLIVEIHTETYLEIKEGSIVRNAMASAEAIKNGIPFDPIKEEIGYEYANTRGMYPEYASGLSHAYEIINKHIDKSENDDSKKIVEKENQGEWIHSFYSEDDKDIYKCSECGRFITLDKSDNLSNYPYCHCGALMRYNHKEENYGNKI